MQVDYLVVGSGFTGAVIARILTDAKRKVLVVERRPYVSGNVYDYTHPSGIRIHAHGPHYFRTSSKQLWEFVNRFSPFDKYEPVVKTYVDGCYENWPVAAQYIQRIAGGNWEPNFKGIPTNFEEAALAMMPRIVYEKFVKGHTEKHWGVPAHTLSKDLANRFYVHKDNDPRFLQHKYQGIPRDGYTALMKNILSGIDVKLNFDYLEKRNLIKHRKMLIFTGSIDEFFSFEFGRLTYRALRREHSYLSNTERYQPYGQVNFPANTYHQMRTIEWKHIMPEHEIADIQGTVITKEIPFSPTDSDQYEYPFPDKKNQQLYQRYKAKAESIPDLLVCGRLGEYKYYDMDQAIKRAIMLARQILAKS